ncbi:MAG TPA: photosynthetic reaction center cytochrome c subunit family protein, partial [Pyrinomonadaceae bacterium]|nr:photosynthetic reaction center cytochrome c subunit family protein [Pyrinomonadaceae bacterium]
SPQKPIGNQQLAIANPIKLVLVAVFSLISFIQISDRPTAMAQQPNQQPRTAAQAFKNIQVLKEMPASQLQGTMTFIAASLGVDCSHCHTPPAMEKDDKVTKQTARRMMAMMNEINKNFGDKIVVNCATCHRGHTKPTAIPPLPPLGSSFSVSTVAADQPVPTVDSILDRYLQALGGSKAIDKVRTRTRKGSVEIAGVRGTFEIYEAAPNKSLLIGSLPPPLGSVNQGFDGTTGWVKNQNGVFAMSGDGLAQTKRESNFYADIKLKEQFQTMNVIGRERVGGREFYVVEGTRDDRQVEKLFFDVSSGLLVRRSWETPTYFGQLPNMTDFDNYRKVGGVWWPFLLRRSRGGTMFLQNISEIKLNAPMDDSMFKKPVVQK